MSGAQADPGLAALLLWIVLPASLLVAAGCLALWWPRRGWTVLHGRVLGPAGEDAVEVAIAGPDGAPQLVRLRPLRPGALPRPGVEVALSHPPGRPEALQQGTPGPLLAGAIAAGLLAALCVAIIAGP